MAQEIINSVHRFIEKCRLGPEVWRYSSTPGGQETLYASSFVCMIYYYTGYLNQLTADQLSGWADYLNSWQDESTGYFIGPELVYGEITSKKHSLEHIQQHLAVHVLPALTILGAQPKHPLAFARPFTDLEYLDAWLDARNWREAWLEGNNLLFVGQFLIHLRDVEKNRAAQQALDRYFSWLDQSVDPATGLWGSNGYCPRPVALYGGYHQLLVYYYENRALNYPERLVDVSLSLQHPDGGFNPFGGGGACEDVDAIDVLVNLYKRTNYRRAQIRISLRKSLVHLLSMQMPDGGFVYRLNQPFDHMGLSRTASKPDQSNLFPTWFRVHTLALVSEILTDEPNIQWNWKFNPTLSMGWHAAWDKHENRLKTSDRLEENKVRIGRKFKHRFSPISIVLQKLASNLGK